MKAIEGWRNRLSVSMIKVSGEEFFYTECPLCHAAGDGVGGYVVFVGGGLDEVDLLHGALDDVAHLQEPDALFEECRHAHLIGGVEDAGHIASALQGLERKGEVAEAYGVGLLEGEAR